VPGGGPSDVRPRGRRRLGWTRPADDAQLVLLRFGLAALAAAALGVHPAPQTRAGWNRGEQRLVVRAGIMRPLGDGRFDGGRALGAGATRRALAAIAARESPAVAAVGVVAGAAPLTLVGFDALLVDQLGLRRVAVHVERVARRAGLDPPVYSGSEVVARYLGLRDVLPLSSGWLHDSFAWARRVL
jgi:hypothetical protein